MGSTLTHNNILAMTNLPTYDVTEIITAVKSFILETSGDIVTKLFTTVSNEFS
jgi:hypothetical protein